MFEFAFAAHNVPFAAALALVPLVAAAQAMGFGEADGGALDWLGAGRAPLFVVLLIFLMLFGAGGMALQRAAQALAGATLSPWLAAPLALAVALPLTRAAARFVGEWFPEAESSAVDLESLLGRRAVITVGRARIGAPARARVRDAHGHAHHVMVEPESADERFAERDEVLLVRRDGDRFRAIATAPDPLLQPL